MWVILSYTLQGTNISRFQGTFEDDFPFPKVGYVNSLEGICFWTYLIDVILTIGFQSNHWTPFYCTNGMSQGVSSSCWTIFEVDEHVPSYTMLYTHSKPGCFTGIYCGYNYLRTRMGPVERRSGIKASNSFATMWSIQWHKHNWSILIAYYWETLVIFKGFCLIIQDHALSTWKSSSTQAVLFSLNTHILLEATLFETCF